MNDQKSLIRIILLIFGILMLAAASSTGHTAAAQTHPPTPTPLPDPYEDIFLRNKNIPQSAWRPPLYPAPYAATPHDHFYFSRPIGVDEVNWPLPSYRYGGSFFSPDIIHTGVDIAAPEGTPVLAAASGQVLWAGVGLLNGDDAEDDPYGNAIAIKHDFGWDNETLYTVYAHLSEIQVTKGEYVETGDVIGLSGSTGFTTGPHLHFEIRLGSNNFYLTFNPELWLTPPQGFGVIAATLASTEGESLIGQEVILTNMESNQVWRGKSYGSIFTVNGDPFYNENFVVSDLPAGNYKVQIVYSGNLYTNYYDIHPGRITYFYFLGPRGFSSYTPSVLPPSNIENLISDD